MVEQTQNEIRDRAYELWQAEGCIEGKDMDFWLRAEQEILGAPSMAPNVEPTNGSGNGAAPVAAKPAAKRKPAAKKATGTTAAKKPAARKPAAKKTATKATAAKAPAKPRATKAAAPKATTGDAS